MAVPGVLLLLPSFPPPRRRRRITFSPPVIRSSLPPPSPPSFDKVQRNPTPSQSTLELMMQKGPYNVESIFGDWVSKNDSLARSIPIYVGGLSLLAVLVSRTFSGVAPIADASSSQSRADIVTLSLAVTNLLTGLVWVSIRPKYVSPVVSHGVECRRISSGIPDHAVQELLWAWESLSSATCSRSLVVVYGDDCLLQIGVAANSSVGIVDAVGVDVQKLVEGSLYRSVMKSAKQSYLANLSLYPGRSELPFLPTNTQAVILQPIGNKGIAIIGGDTIRGFSNLDQAWITLIADKLYATLL